MSLDRYLAGEDGCLQAAITESMPLAEQMVRTLITKAPGFAYLEDDLIGEMNLLLVEWIPKMRETASEAEKLNPQGYLSTAMHRRIINFVNEQTSLDAPSTSRRRAEKNGDGDLIDTPFVSGQPFDFTLANDDRAEQERAAIDLRMTIDDCCQSREERMIVDMRARGFTQTEIAEELGMSQKVISRTLAELQTRVEKAIA